MNWLERVHWNNRKGLTIINKQIIYNFKIDGKIIIGRKSSSPLAPAHLKSHQMTSSHHSKGLGILCNARAEKTRDTTRKLSKGSLRQIS